MMSPHSNESPTPSVAQIEADEFEYWAFISYSQKDSEWADRLQKALETYRVPRHLRSTKISKRSLPKRLFPIYRDTTEEASSSDLGAAIQRNLRQSRCLVVICSPRSAKSHWVNEEIGYFKNLGHGDRILCLIVDGTPNALDPLEECFPLAVRTRGKKERSSTETHQIQPIAPDARGGRRARKIAFIKIIAGILDVKFDGLWRRERRRFIRQMIWYGLAAFTIVISVVATYVSLADAGVAVPAEKIIQKYLDRYELSFLRPAHSMSTILTTMEDARKGIISRLSHEWENAEWTYTTPNRTTAPKRTISPWVSSQAACAALRAIESGDPKLNDFSDMLDAPFSNGFPTKLGWYVGDADYPQIHPALWTIAALAVAIRRTDLFSRNQIEHFKSRLEDAENIADLYQPLPDGGWNVVPSQINQQRHSVPATALAFLALLELNKAKLGWHHDRAQLKRMLDRTAKWLSERFDPADPVPGWLIHLNDTSTGNTGEISDGLTLQIYSEFLRAEDEADIGMPPIILQSIPRHIFRLVGRRSNYPVNRGLTSRYYTTGEGPPQLANVVATYPWHPWAIELSARWLHRLERLNVAPEEIVDTRRTLGYLVVGLSQNLRAAKIGPAPTYIASETLYALATIHSLYYKPNSAFTK
jgi:hypothetical protein